MLHPTTFVGGGLINYLSHCTFTVSGGIDLIMLLFCWEHELFPPFRSAQSCSEDPQQCNLPVCQPLLHGWKCDRDRFHHLHPKIHRVSVWNSSLQRQHLHWWAEVHYLLYDLPSFTPVGFICHKNSEMCVVKTKLLCSSFCGVGFNISAA